MKPEFALNLTHDSIGLLHRTSRGWLEVGSAALDDPDLPEALGYLRRSALGLSPAGFTSKLVIPNSQILYLTVDAPGPDATARKAQIRAALEGRTPYAVDDLVFDWWGTGPEVHAAVVARETLEEAESFAVQNRFSPVSFVAIPDDVAFGGEPWFGPTVHAATLLGPGEKVERDQDPVSIVAREMPRPGPDGAEVPVVASAPVSNEELAAQPEAPGSTLPEERLAEATPLVGTPAPPAVPVVDAPGPVEAEPSDLPAAPRLTASVPADFASLVPDAALADAGRPPVPSVAVEPAHRRDPPPPTSDIEPRPLPVRRFGAPVVPGDITDPQVIEPDAPVSFASRRAHPSDGGEIGPARTPLQTALAVAARGKGNSSRTPVTASAMRAVDEENIAIKVRPTGQVPATSGVSEPRPRAAAARPMSAGQPGAAAVPLKVAADPRRDRPRAGTALPDSFGSRPVATSGRPRYLGLILTGVLLLLLAVVAAWSSFYLASGQRQEPAALVSASSSTAVRPSSEAPSTAAAPSLEIVASGGQQPGTAAPPAPAGQAQAAPEPAPSAAPPATARLDPPEAPPVATATASGPAVPQPAPPPQVDEVASDVGEARPDEIVLSTSDAPPAPQAAVPAPVLAARPDAQPLAQLAPPPFGTVYTFDAAGRIAPTAEGVVTPEGITLFAGRPDKTPPARPARTGATPEATPVAIEPAALPLPQRGALPDAAAGGLSVVAPVAELPVPDPALAGLRPRTRPAGLGPVQNEASTQTAPADPALAGMRPSVRPAEIVAAVSAREQTEAASLAIANAAPVPTGSPLAIAISSRPTPRPDNFAKAVESAVAAAVREAPAGSVEVATTAPAAQATLRVRQPTAAEEPARVEPEADDETEQASAPVRSVNNRGTVAKNATFANAINLRDINLIGVYGSQSNRYALIRQANGRYKKVQVGDRIGGGVIAAITADQVRYQKGNRMYALEMPRG